MRPLIGFLLLMALTGCTRPELVQLVDLPVLPRQPVVVCVLTPGDSVQLMLARPSALGEPFSTSANTINGATVQLSRDQPAQSVTLVALRPGVYGASQRNFPIRAGQTYKLTVQTPNNPVLTATCQVPAQAAAFTSVIVGQSQVSGSYESRQVNVVWREVDAGNVGYFVGSQQTQNGYVSTSLLSAYYALRDSNFWLDNTRISGAAHGTYAAKILLVTADLNLTKFKNVTDLTESITRGQIEDALTGFKGILPQFTNIQNGLGFFGACVHTDTTLIIHD